MRATTCCSAGGPEQAAAGRADARSSHASTGHAHGRRGGQGGGERDREEGPACPSSRQRHHDQWLELTAKKPKAEGGAKTDDPSASIMDMMKQMYDDGDDSMKKAIGEPAASQELPPPLS